MPVEVFALSRSSRGAVPTVSTTICTLFGLAIGPGVPVMQTEHPGRPVRGGPGDPLPGLTDDPLGRLGQFGQLCTTTANRLRLRPAAASRTPAAASSAALALADAAPTGVDQ